MFTVLLCSFRVCLFLFRISDIRQSAGEAALYLMGFLYVPLLLGHLVLVRGEPHGIQWILLLLVIVMSGDSAAFYIGSSFGRKKLYPIVSPNKSIEGALGGWGKHCRRNCCKIYFFAEVTMIDAVVMAVVLGVLGQVGDLFESLLKRSFGVKDSGPSCRVMVAFWTGSTVSSLLLRRFLLRLFRLCAEMTGTAGLLSSINQARAENSS